MSTRDWKGTRPHTRMGALSLLRARLAQVQGKIDKAPARARAGAGADGDAALTRGGRGHPRHPAEAGRALRVHVHKIDDIASLLRLQEEFGIGVTVDHACDVNDGHIYSRPEGARDPGGLRSAGRFRLQGGAQARELAQRPPPPGERRGLRPDDRPPRHPPAQSPPRAAVVHALRAQPPGCHRDHHAAQRPDPRHRRDARDAGKGEVGLVLLLERGPVRRHALPGQGRSAEGEVVFEEGGAKAEEA